MDWIQELPTGVREFVSKLLPLPDFPLQLARFANALRSRDREKGAVARDLAVRAWSLARVDRRVCLSVDWAVRKRVPGWHFSIVRDEGRNRVYEEALNRFVTRETTVLEIGTGTGILAMLAARSGARHVYTCELEPLIAEAARENIRRNGFADRITVIGKKSSELVVGEDIPEPVDLLVSEIVDNGLLGEGVLPVMEDAKCRLLKPDAPILPSRIALRGALVGGSEWMRKYRLGDVLGLDLSAFNTLAPPVHAPNVVGCSLDEALSGPMEIFHFDFMLCDRFPEERRVLSVPVARSGVVEGFLQWIHLDFGGVVEFENKPPAESCWNPLFHLFPRPVEVKAGESLSLVVEHDRVVAAVYPSQEEFVFDVDSD